MPFALEIEGGLRVRRASGQHLKIVEEGGKQGKMVGIRVCLFSTPFQGLT